MSFIKDSISLESKSKFLFKIQDYYKAISNGKIPDKLLKSLIINITDKQYRFYEECWKKYPKSKKRYSSLVIDDLETSINYFSIIDFLEKQKIGKIKTEEYCKILFKMNGKELKKITNYKNWYENK